MMYISAILCRRFSEQMGWDTCVSGELTLLQGSRNSSAGEGGSMVVEF
jgi:hypothetical protein